MFYFPNPGTPCLRILFDELLFTTHITYALWRPDYARLFAQAKLRKLRTSPKTDTLFCSSQSVLREAYGDPTAVTDELVECIKTRVATRGGGGFPGLYFVQVRIGPFPNPSTLWPDYG